MRLTRRSASCKRGGKQVRCRSCMRVLLSDGGQDVRRPATPARQQQHTTFYCPSLLAAAAAAARKAGPAQPSLPGGAAANRVLQAAKRLAK